MTTIKDIMSTFNSHIATLDAKARQDQIKAEEEAEIKAKHNHNKFLQIDKTAIKDFRALITKNATAANLLMLLTEKMNRQNAVMMSYETMIKLTGYSKSSVTRCISHLKKEQWIEVIKVGTANIYRINSRAFWQSYGNLKYTAFSAEIIAFSDEQIKGVVDCKTNLKTVPIIEVDEDVILVGKDEPPTNEELDFHK